MSNSSFNQRLERHTANLASLQISQDLLRWAELSDPPGAHNDK
jgi:hypothetical protein